MPGLIRTLPFAALSILAACNLSLLPQAVPTLSNVNGALLPDGPGGSTVILAGAGFGDVQGSGRVTFTPVGGGVILLPTITSWSAAAIVAIVPPAALGDFAINVQSNNGITSGSALFTVTPPVTFTPSAVTWTADDNLPSAVSGAGLAFARIGSANYVYVVGGAGAGGAPVNTVYYDSVNANGTLGAWKTTVPLPTALAFPAAVAATQRNSAVITNGFLYVLGGTTDATGTPVATVYRAPIAFDGSLGTWVSTTALPAPLRSHGAVIQYGSLYVVGGATTGNAPVATVYRSPIQVDGAVTWKQQLPLPAARARFGMGVMGQYLYVVGGESGAIAPNDPTSTSQSTVYFAKLNPSTRDIATAWAPTTALGNARAASTAVFAAGNALAIGGLYAGASTHTSEAEYAAINADGTTGTFATAAPATSINSLCSCNLFNHATIGYQGSNGAFHVLVAGGDNVSAPGTRRVETFTY